MWIMLAVLFPILSGGMLPIWKPRGRRGRQHYVLFVSCMTAVLSLTAISEMKGAEAVVLVHLGERLSVAFQVDGLGCVFGTMVSLLWPLACLYALEYMSRRGERTVFFPSIWLPLE